MQQCMWHLNIYNVAHSVALNQASDQPWVTGHCLTDLSHDLYYGSEARMPTEPAALRILPGRLAKSSRGHRFDPCTTPSWQTCACATTVYADDLAVLSHSGEGFQELLNRIEVFCHDRALTVRIDKTNVGSKIQSCLSPWCALQFYSLLAYHSSFTDEGESFQKTN